MELTAAQTTILKTLRVRVLTEHELTEAVASQLRQKEVEVQSKIGQMLIELRDMGFVWAGQCFNRNRQHMWCAALTKAGREKIGARAAE